MVRRLILLILALNMAILSHGQSYIYNLTMADSASNELYNCSDNVLWFPGLPRNADIIMKHGSVNRIGDNLKVYAGTSWQTGGDTLVILTPDGNLISRTYWRYKHCREGNRAPTYPENNMLRLGIVNTHFEHTLTDNFAFYLTKDELVRKPKLYLIAPSYQVARYTFSYTRHGAADSPAQILVGTKICGWDTTTTRTQELDVQNILLTLNPGDMIFFEDIYFWNSHDYSKPVPFGSIAFMLK